VSGSSFALENYEYSFQQDLNGDGTPGLTATTMELFGATKLSQFGNTYVMSPATGGAGVQIKYNGAVVTSGLFGAWAPIGAEAITGGYEVAWKLGTSQYSIWLTDGNGNMTSNSTGVVAGTSSALRAYELSFHQDLNGDTVIGSMDPAGEGAINGSGSLTLVGSNSGVTIVRAGGTLTNNGSVGLAITDFTNGDAGGSMNLAVMGHFMAS